MEEGQDVRELETRVSVVAEPVILRPRCQHGHECPHAGSHETTGEPETLSVDAADLVELAQSNPGHQPPEPWHARMTLRDGRRFVLRAERDFAALVEAHRNRLRIDILAEQARQAEVWLRRHGHEGLAVEACAERAELTGAGE